MTATKPASNSADHVLDRSFAIMWTLRELLMPNAQALANLVIVRLT